MTSREKSAFVGIEGTEARNRVSRMSTMAAVIAEACSNASLK
jgi:hypothetical protein